MWYDEQHPMIELKMSTDPIEVTFKGSMKAGAFTAQLGVSLNISQTSVTMKAVGREYCIERENLQGLVETSMLGIFKRGIRFVHRQPGLPNDIVFYPSVSREQVRQAMSRLGWQLEV